MDRTFAGHHQAFAPQNGFEGRRRTFWNCGALARKMRLREKMPHFRDDGTLGIIAAQPSKCIAHNRGSSRAHCAVFSKWGCGTFVAFFFTCAVHVA